MKTKHFIYSILFMCLSQISHAQQIKLDYKPNKIYEIPKWEVLDVLINVKTKIQNPYTADFGALFTHENGTTQKVPGFYNGKNEWVLRFSSSLEGTWKYVTYGVDSKLSNKKGKIVVTKALQNNHGGIVIDKKNKQRFSYQDGTPYFLLAFECDWLYALDYENKKEIPKTNHLLNLIAENGFNQIVMNVFSYDVSWKKDEKLKEHPEHEFGGPKNIFPFLGNNEKPDFSELNPEFFKKLDRTISLMHNKRIASHLMIYVWNKLVSWPDMNTKEDNMYFDYIIKRYQAFPNIVWDISKEALFYGRADEKYINERIDRARSLDSYHRLLSVHDFKFCSKNSDKVDFISTQDWSHNIYNKMLEAKTKFKNKPIFNIEHGGYEESPYVVFTGTYTNAEYCLRRNYMCLFAGVHTTYYWQGTSWNAIIYNPFEQPKDFYKPKFEYFKHMQDLFTKIDFSTLEPTPQKNGSGYNLTNKKGTVLLYVGKENYAIKAWFLNKKYGKRSFEWFNTLTGETKKIEAPKGSDFYSPWREKADAILISKLLK